MDLRKLSAHLRSKLKRYYSEILTLNLVLGDVVAITLSILLGYFIYHQIDIELFGFRTVPQKFHIYLKLSAFFNTSLVIIFGLLGLYKRQVSILNIEETKKIFKGVAIGILLFFMVTFYAKIPYFSRLIMTYSLIFMLILINVERFLIYKLYQYLHLKGVGVKNILIYGAGETGQLLAKRLVNSPVLGFLPVGFIYDDINQKSKIINGGTFANPKYLPIFGRLKNLETIVKDNKVDEIFIATPSCKIENIFNVIRKCEELRIRYSFVPNLFGIKIQNIAYKMIGNIPLLTLKEHKINYINKVTKRCFDIVFSAIVLTIFSPLFLIISILIKRDSKGPLIFKQERVGKDGKLFEMHKFRTMYVDSPIYTWGPKTINDPRITKFGKFLRRTSLDELPQFWDVLGGNMSVVGPRPEMSFIVKTYNELHKERLRVQPGITGLWQISGDRGKEIHEDINYDLYYIENMSILLDIVIILRSIGVSIKGVGAF